jgi:hypothetical protein
MTMTWGYLFKVKWVEAQRVRLLSLLSFLLGQDSTTDEKTDCDSAWDDSDLETLDIRAINAQLFVFLCRLRQLELRGRGLICFV